MKNINTKRIEDYLKRVASDAFKSEERTGIFRAQFAKLDDVIMLRYETSFRRIDRKIMYRLVRNFENATGYHIVINNQITNNTVTAVNSDLNDKPGRPYMEVSSVDPNHTIAFCTLLGKSITINCYRYDEKGRNREYLNPDFDKEEFHSIICEKLIAMGKDTTFGGKTGWNEYCDAYRQIYGFTPKAQDKLFVSNEIKCEFDFAPSKITN